MSHYCGYTNDAIQEYVTKDGSLIRELLHPAFVPGLGAAWPKPWWKQAPAPSGTGIRTLTKCTIAWKGMEHCT